MAAGWPCCTTSPRSRSAVPIMKRRATSVLLAFSSFAAAMAAKDNRPPITPQFNLRGTPGLSAAARRMPHVSRILSNPEKDISFPPGCSWECYLVNNPYLSTRIPYTEEAALNHYLTKGMKEGEDCTCKSGGEDGGSAEPATVYVKPTGGKDTFVHDILSGRNDDVGQKEKEDLEASFPPGCSWECYLSNYINLSKKFHTEEAALDHYLNYGIKMGRDCTCKEENVVVDPSLEKIEEVEEELTQLDFQDDDNAVEETEKLEAAEEELIEDSFPPGCSWECYLGNYINLSENLPHTEEAALDHYLNYGIKMGRDCTCKKENVVLDPSLEKIEEVEEELIQLDFQDDDNAVEETEKLEVEEEELVADSFPPGCSWECYLDNYFALAKNLPHTEEAALDHYLNYGIKKGKDCSCRKEDVVVDPSLEEIKEVEEELIQLDFQDDDNAVEETEKLEVEEEELIADSFPPGCSWECYLDNYFALAKNLPHTEEAALDHYLNYGIKKGKDCSCRMDEDMEDNEMDG